ncbi:MAG: putative toxin-antitoxin system toxin component, PIN family [Acidobacteriota bacterium]
MRIVLDTNILVRAGANPDGLARRVLEEIVRGPHTLIISPFILGELARVLGYPRLRQRWGLGEERIEAHVNLIAAAAEVVHPGPSREVVTGDPDDDPVVETAVAGRADVLCTRDAHLLGPRVVEYCAGHGVRVMDDLALHRLLASLQTTTE